MHILIKTEYNNKDNIMIICRYHNSYNDDQYTY